LFAVFPIEDSNTKVCEHANEDSVSHYGDFGNGDRDDFHNKGCSNLT